MKPLRLLTAVAVAAGILTATAATASALPASAKILLAHRYGATHLTASRELALSNRTIHYANDVLGFLRSNPEAGTPSSRRTVRRQHEWLLRVATTERSDALSRLVVNVPVVGDWQTAVRVVQRWYPGTDWWLLSCSGGEGGHGVWKWNGGAPLGSPHYGSDAGGWLQYFEGTFWGDFNASVRYLAARGVHVPRSAWSWYSPTGQALAGAWAYGHSRPPGKWLGSGC